MACVFKRGLQAVSYLYFFMVVKTAPETVGYLYILRSINFIQAKSLVFNQYIHSVFQHGAGQSAGGRCGKNLPPEAFGNQFGNPAEMIYMGMSHKKNIYCFGVILKRRPVDV